MSLSAALPFMKIAFDWETTPLSKEDTDDD
jgi:hypothetical protein